MRPDTRSVTLTLAITLPVLCAVAVGIGRTAEAHVRPVQLTTNSVAGPSATKIAGASAWNVHHGPDPFLLPQRPKSDPPIQVPLRKVYHVDTPFVGRAKIGEGLTGKPPIPQVTTETIDTTDRMAGFLSGNGVYAVLATPDRTMVVNPGDRVDDDRVVSDIQPTSLHLVSHAATSLVTLRSTP